MKRYLLEYSQGLLQKTFFTLEADTIIGRDPQNTICLTETGVSRRHARLSLRNGQWELADLGSRNGTLVNGERIQSRFLKHGDVIRICKNNLRFIEVEEEAKESHEGAVLKETEEVTLADFPQEIQEQMDLVKTFLEALPTGVAIINERMQVRYSNQALASYRVSDAHEEGESLGVLLSCPETKGGAFTCGPSPGCAKCPLHAASVRVFREQGPSINMEILWHTKGEILSTHVRFSMIPLPYRLTGEPLAQLTWEDITSRKVAQEALRRAHKELEGRVEERTAELRIANEQLKQEIQDRKRAEEEIKHLSHRLIDIAEEGRKRLARDLHDECGQSLSALHLGIETLQHSIPEEHDIQRQKCSELISLTQQLGDTIRNISQELRPNILDDLGLIPALEWCVEDFAKRMRGIQIEFEAHGFKKRIDPQIEIVLYRIVQESLNNIARHARAKHVSVLIAYSHPKTILSIKDDGVGFEQTGVLQSIAQKQGIGLLGMRERVSSVGGTIEIRSREGKGTTIRVELPVLQRAKDA